MIISKKLLSKVLDEEILNVDDALDYNILGYEYRNKVFNKGYWVRENKNIHELTHMCKEWARSEGYTVSVIQYKDAYLSIVNFTFTLDLSDFNKSGNINTYDGMVKSNTEIDAVVCCCQWILDNKE